MHKWKFYLLLMSVVLSPAISHGQIKIFGAGTTGPNGNDPFRWELEENGARRNLSAADADPVAVKAGEIVEWHSGTGFHGAIFGGKTKTQFESLFEVLPGGLALAADPNGQTGWGTKGAGPNNLILKVRTKEGVSGDVHFHCSVHGLPMKGKVGFAVRSPESFKIFGAGTTGPNGKDPFRWELEDENGRRNLSETGAAPLAVKAGDSIVWHSGTGFHGVVFGDSSKADFESSFEVLGGLTLVSNPRGQTGWGTDGIPRNNLVLRVRAKKDLADMVRFHCSVHGLAMNGRIVESGSTESVALSLSPNVQRRMLRFVNRARSVGDLTKSPQERRGKFEHGPSAAKPKFDRRHERVIAYDDVSAKVMLDNRPINGYTDVRSCLKLYGNDKAKGLSELIDSLGPKQFGEWRVAGQVRERDENGVPKEEEPVMHAALLHTGKVLLIPNNDRTVLWDPNAPADKAIEIIEGAVSGLNANLFCSGHSFLPDGRLLVVGGGGGGPGAPSSVQGWKFDPKTSKWSRTANDMAFRRWYPTLVTLPDEPGKILVAAGATGPGLAGFMEMYSADTDRFERVTAGGPVGELLFPPTYPGLHLLPSGDVFHVPVGFGDCNQTASGLAADPTALFSFSNPKKTVGVWTTFANNHRRKGMSALLLDSTSPFVKGLVIGGGDAGTNGTGQTINLGTRSPSWDPAFPLLEKRVHPNVVLLPDGTVFICGGIEEAPKPPPNGGRCEMYDPRTGSIAEMDELDRPRHYHSVAILLPTGEIMATGGAGVGGCDVSRHNTIEVFKPPYLFRGNRPVINSVRQEVEHLAAFEIDTDDPLQISKVVLARPMAVTHQTDSEQRMVSLKFSATGPKTIEAIAPAGAPSGIAPAGYYMLFILDQDGVPSVAKWILLK